MNNTPEKRAYYERPKTHKAESQKIEFLKRPKRAVRPSHTRARFGPPLFLAILFLPNLKWSMKLGPNFTE
jgi:hypothetical protein